MSGGAGADLIQYAMNAPVNIDGGDGFDRVIIIGTEFGDDVVVTRDAIYGTGLNVNYVNIESLSVDGAEGDDRFYVLSTDEAVVTEIFGGLGSDTFNMSGDTPPIISNDLRGHSGVITHDIENACANCDLTKIAGISANVADRDVEQPVVVISNPDGALEITEGGSSSDSYFVFLSKAPNPGETVTVQVVGPVQTQDDKERGAKLFRLDSPDPHASVPGGTTISFTFTDSDWFQPREVRISAPDDGDTSDDTTPDPANPDIVDSDDFDDDAIEGDRTGVINHMVNTAIGITGSPASVTSFIDGDKRFTMFVDNGATLPTTLSGYMLLITDGPGAGQSLRTKEVVNGQTLTLYGQFRSCDPVGPSSIYQIRRDIEADRSLVVLVLDNDLPTVVITETDNAIQVFEDGAGDTINVVLTRPPASEVKVHLTNTDGQLSFDKTTLIFTDKDWDTPQAVTVSAASDTTREGFHHGLIHFTVESGDVEATKVSTEIFPLTTPQSYVALKNNPDEEKGITVTVDGVVRASTMYDVVSNKIVFLKEGVQEYESLKGPVGVTYSYDEPGYDGLEVKPILVDIADNEVPQVLITESGGSTDVVESQYAGGLFTEDAYEVVLTQAPTKDVKVRVTPQVTKTSAGGTIHWGRQVTVTSSSPGAKDNGDGTVTLTFTPANWNTP